MLYFNTLAGLAGLDCIIHGELEFGKGGLWAGYLIGLVEVIRAVRVV